jgi:hypothetical protein
MTTLPERPYPADQVSLNNAIAGPFYPDVETHTWGAFAFLAIEAGGYGDLEVVNPYNGRRLTAPVCTESGYGTGPADLSIYDQLRLLVDELERSRFLDSTT